MFDITKESFKVASCNDSFSFLWEENLIVLLPKYELLESSGVNASLHIED